MSFNEILRKAEQFSEQFGQWISDEQLQGLIQTCIPYFIYLRKDFGFFRIPIEVIKSEIAPSAINQAFLIQQRRKILFSYCLKNAFRDCCRQHLRSLREHDTTNIISQCDIEEQEKLRTGTRFPAPPTAAEDNELIGRANSILENHDPFSKKVVLQKTRGSTYPDMADIFSTPLNECKRVYWHDINHIREKLNPNPEEERI